MFKPLFAVMALAALTACSEGAGRGGLVDRISDRQGPDEFTVIPQKPLELPENLAQLPTPQPGAPSRTDLRPDVDARVALGGTGGPSANTASDNAIAAATGGTTADIRNVLRREDNELRSRGSGLLLLERAAGVSAEGRQYRDQILDPGAEMERLRAAGVRTPAAPPADE
ncbi:DUF3035 domain-containing protein [Paracoccaceae bacterium GXU_MW_L88]